MHRALSRPSVASAPTPSAVTRIEWGTRGNLEDQFLFSFVNLNHWQILSWRLDIRGGFTDQWSHHYLFNISSGAVYYIFILSWGFLRGGYHPPLFSSVAGGVLGEPQRTIPPHQWTCIEHWRGPRTFQLWVSFPSLTQHL